MHLLSRFSLLALIGIALFLPGCFEDENNPVATPYLKYDLESHLDTIYAAVNDSALFSFDSYIGSESDLFLQLDYGDGTNETVPYRYHGEFAHCYSNKGTYTVFASAMIDQRVVARDTTTVIVQDYVRPSQFKTMTITVTGLELFSYNVIKRSGLKDSVFITSQRDFTFSSARWDDDLPAPVWQWRYNNSANRSQSGAINGGKASCNMWVQFSPDGSWLQEVGMWNEFTDSSGDTTYIEHCDPQVHAWLSLSGPASLNSATYTHTIPKDRWHPANFDPQITEEWTAEGYSHMKRVFHQEPYSDVTITVEFHK